MMMNMVVVMMMMMMRMNMEMMMVRMIFRDCFSLSLELRWGFDAEGGFR